MNELQKPITDKTNIDGIQMVVLAHMLQWNITVVHMEGFWSTDVNMATDIIIAYVVRLLLEPSTIKKSDKQVY